MTESIKFGPEWLRNSVANVSIDQQSATALMNSLNSAISAAAGGRPQLSENRYGREEMLSLWEKSVKRPEILPRYKKLYVEEAQCPLALTPQTEDDVRIWQIRNPVSVGFPGRGGGRGGSIDRGRGRARAPFHSTLGYQRSTSLYDDTPGGGSNGRVSLSIKTFKFKIKIYLIIYLNIVGRKTMVGS